MSFCEGILGRGTHLGLEADDDSSGARGIFFVGLKSNLRGSLAIVVLVDLKSNFRGDFLLAAKESRELGPGLIPLPAPELVLCLLVEGELKEANSANWDSKPEPGLELAFGEGFGLLDPLLAPLAEPPPR